MLQYPFFNHHTQYSLPNTKNMNRIDKLFQQRSEPVLNIYFTAGFPELNDTRKILKGLEEAGADLIEIGIPFSDPVADGPTIQESTKRLSRGSAGAGSADGLPQPDCAVRDREILPGL
jgi:hypothetical protein